MKPFVWSPGIRLALILIVAVVPAGLVILWQARPFASEQPAALVAPDKRLLAITPSVRSTSAVPGRPSSSVAPAMSLPLALPDGHPAVAPASGGPRKAVSGDAHAVDVDVALDGSAASLPVAARVYVFVRVPDRPMPLAVEQFDPKSLPARVRFGVPDPGEGALEIVGRLTLDGGVRRQAGDVETVMELSDRAAPGDPVRLVLRVPPG